jgi:predicted small secreted protein
LLNKLTVIALLLSVSLLSGCNGTTGSGIQETTTQGNGQPVNTTTVQTAKAENSPPTTGDAVRIARWSKDPKGGNLLAPLKGQLAIVNNCLVVQNHQSEPPTLPIFPYDKGVWDDVKKTFTFGGKVIKIGETIEGGGGTILKLDTLGKAGIKYDVPDCGVKSLFLVFF